jgi:hypothetical protein
MSNDLRVTVEIGPKAKKAAAVAADWPGLERGGKTARAAIEALQEYIPRYRPVAALAGADAEFAAVADIDVVEEYTGPGSTDFWGISFGFSGIDRERMPDDAVERQLALMRACWTYFDGVRGRVSAEMRKGPRGGGRTRDVIVRHVVANEQDWGKKVGIRTPEGAVVTGDDELKAWRDAYCTAIRTFHAGDKAARTWPLRYLIRHTAYHVMDHTWEMEDKDLSGVDL